MQLQNAHEYLLPFVEEVFPLKKGCRVLEVGCGEAGVLKAFVDKGCYGIGLDLSPSRIETAKKRLTKEVESNQVTLLAKNVYDLDIDRDLEGKVDLIVLKDTIEHIPHQEKIIAHFKELIHPDGAIFFGFPPWHMPYGGHQQMADTKLGKFPFLHLLPMPLYLKALKSIGESEKSIRNLREVKETGISLQRFERISKQLGYTIKKKQLYLVNPIYKYKFNAKPRKQFPIVAAIPGIREFATTTAYYLLTLYK